MSESWRSLLAGLRGSYLAALPLKADHSGSATLLARRAAIRKALPASYAAYREPFGEALKLRLDGKGLELRATRTADARSFFAEVRDQGTVSRAEPGGSPIWIALPEDGRIRWQIDQALEHGLAIRADDELQGATADLDARFDLIGWNPMAVPTPDGSPDPRIAAVARWEKGPRALTAGDLANDVSVTRTLVAVPPESEAVIQRARLLYIRGWNQWEFFTMALREAIGGLEVGLRRGLGSSDRRGLAALINDTKDPSGSGLLTDWERYRAHSLRERRNELVHQPQGPTTEWISSARAGFAESVSLLNVFSGRLAGAIGPDLGREL